MAIDIGSEVLLKQSVNFPYPVYAGATQYGLSEADLAYLSRASRGSTSLSTFSNAAIFLTYAPRELPLPTRPPAPFPGRGGSGLCERTGSARSFSLRLLRLFDWLSRNIGKA